MEMLENVNLNLGKNEMTNGVEFWALSGISIFELAISKEMVILGTLTDKYRKLTNALRH